MDDETKMLAHWLITDGAVGACPDWYPVTDPQHPRAANAKAAEAAAFRFYERRGPIHNMRRHGVTSTGGNR